MTVRWAVAGIALALGLGLGSAQAETKEVTFAHQDMITPFRRVIDQGELEKATGYKVNWRKFGGGGDVVRAMASGDVQIGEMGSSPAAAGASQGLDIQVIWILEDIADGEQLVARKGAGIQTIADLKGKKVATPFVSTSHYQLLAALQDAGVDPKQVSIVNLRPAEIAAAWERGDIDATFVWDPALAKVKADGIVLASSGDIGRKGKPTFDAIVVQKAWAEQNKDFVVSLLKLIDKANADYLAKTDKWVVGSPEVTSVAKISGASAADVPAALAEYRYPTAADQATPAWLGGGASALATKALTDTSAFLKAQGRVADVKPDYAPYVSDAYAKAAAAR